MVPIYVTVSRNSYDQLSLKKNLKYYIYMLIVLLHNQGHYGYNFIWFLVAHVYNPSTCVLVAGE